MPKVTLEFNLPEEVEEAKMAQNAGAYYSMLHDIANYARTLRKYEEREAIPVKEVHDKLIELIADFEY